MNNICLKDFDSIADVMDAIECGDCIKGVVPLENSLGGPINITYDSLLHDYDLMISLEIIVDVNHNLLAPKGVKLEDITDVYSHSQALVQCHHYLDKMDFNIHPTFSTAHAAKNIKKFKNASAIGTLKAAELYDLNVLEKNIQDADNNQTRFIVLSKDDGNKTDCDKTSIAFSLHDDKPGGLYGILGIFAEFKINLTKIESMPSKKALGDYIFFIDFEGNREDEDISKIIQLIEDNTSFFKILGSYHLLE